MSDAPKQQPRRGSRAELVSFLRQRFEPDAELAQLLPFPGNPKDHDQGAIADSVDCLGFFGALLAQERTRYVLAGHGRLEDLRRRGVERGPVLWVKCGKEIARAIVLADNRVSELGGWHEPALASFLTKLARDRGLDGLRGTGFDVEDLQGLAARLEGLDLSGDVLTVRVRDPLKVAAVIAAIRALLAKHPEWDARLEAA